jgi:hypothetical protein
VSGKIFKTYLFIFLNVYLLSSCTSDKIAENQDLKTPQLQRWEEDLNVSYNKFVPQYDISRYPPRTLMFCDIDLKYLENTAFFWSKEVGISGFMLSGISNWYYSKEKILSYSGRLRETSKECKKYGIDSNFIKTALGYKELPDWLDDRAWYEIQENFRVTAKLAVESGCKGIAIDTEPYQISLWDPYAFRLVGYPQSELKKKIFQRGRDLMKAMVSDFPGIEVIILPVGLLHGRGYFYWMDFVNGLMSESGYSAFILADERTYHVTKKKKIEKVFKKINFLMEQKAKNKKAWHKKGTIAFGGWPLGYYRSIKDKNGKFLGYANKKGELVGSYGDKSEWYSIGEFEEQIRTFESLCPKYIWIYGHGSSWWQVDPKKYPGLHENQSLATISNIDAYFAVVSRSKGNDLRDYYKSIFPFNHNRGIN